MLLLSSLAAAQPALRIHSAAMVGNRVELQCRATCDGAPSVDVGPDGLILTEDGRQISDYRVLNSTWIEHVGAGIAIVLDGSAGMAGEKQAAAKRIAHALVDSMDGVVDEATVTLFNDHPVTYQEFTTIIPMLRSAIDVSGANAGSALYDALYLSVTEVAYNTWNRGQAVVLVTGSTNDSSYRTLTEVLQLAVRRGVPIHTIALGTDVDTTELRGIAEATGGRYYLGEPSREEIGELFHHITTKIRSEGPYVWLVYHRQCRDGGEREVILQWRAPCGGTVADTISYTAAYDSSSVQPLHLALAADTTLAEQHMYLRLWVVDPVDGRERGPIAFTLQYDTTLLSFPYASMPRNSLIEDEDIRLEAVPGGVRIVAGNDQPWREWKEGEAPLMGLIFRAHAPAGRGDTIPYVIAVTDAAFVEGCPDLTIDDAHGVILAHGPVLGFTGEHPWEVFRDRRTGLWDPSEFLIEVRLFNWGDRPAQDISGMLVIDTTKLFFISPLSGEYVHPGGVLEANDHIDIVWKVGVREGIVPPDSATSCMTMYAAGGWSETCCCRVFFRDAPLSADDVPAVASPTLTVWPNPASGRVSVAIPEQSRSDGVLSVFDALGRTMMIRDIPNGRSREVLDLSALPRGLYMIRYTAVGKAWMTRCLLDR